MIDNEKSVGTVAYAIYSQGKRGEHRTLYFLQPNPEENRQKKSYHPSRLPDIYHHEPVPLQQWSSDGGSKPAYRGFP